jgi:folate-binding protein YgfZ
MPSQSSLPLRALHAAFGGVVVERDGRRRVASYGEAGGEYAAGRGRSGLVDLEERGVLEASGPKRQTLLQGLLSNEVGSLQPGQGRRAALLTVKGAIQALVRALVEEDLVALELEAARIEGVRRTLEHYRVAAPVRFVERPTAVLGVIGPEAGEVLRAAGVEAPAIEEESHARGTIAGQRVRVARAGDLPGGGFVVHAPPAAAAAVWQALHFAGARPVGRDALDALRVEAFRPWQPADVADDNLLHETGLLAECHAPEKGCYLGQEVVARLEGRGGNVNRALRALRLGAPAAAGDAITFEAKDVGRLTTAAVSPRTGPIALAYVHRGAFAPGAVVLVNGAPATVVERVEE